MDDDERPVEAALPSPSSVVEGPEGAPAASSEPADGHDRVSLRPEHAEVDSAEEASVSVDAAEVALDHVSDGVAVDEAGPVAPVAPVAEVLERAVDDEAANTSPTIGDVAPTVGDVGPVAGDVSETGDVITSPPTPAGGESEWAEVIGEAVSKLPTLDAAQEAPAEPQAATNGARVGASRPLPRILAIANQKGGVGKTTTAVNLGAGLAELGYRVLVVDLDPQGNATTGLGINSRSLSCSVYDVLLSDTPLDDCIEPTAVRNLFVAPATIDLAGAEIELVSSFSRELKLRRALAELGDDYDYTLIDCPPSLGLLTVNGLAAASEVLVPIQCEYYALEGLGQLLRNVQLVQNNLNPRLELSAIVLTMFDARTRLADQVATEVRSHFGPKVCRNIIPRTVRLSEAPSFGQPIIVFDSSSRGALAYRELAKEVSGGTPQRIG